MVAACSRKVDNDLETLGTKKIMFVAVRNAYNLYAPWETAEQVVEDGVVHMTVSIIISPLYSSAQFILNYLTNYAELSEIICERIYMTENYRNS